MPAKYHIHTQHAPPRLRPVGKLGIVDWREDCAGCHNCVKKSCIYGLFRDESDSLHHERGYLDYIYQCKGCLNCIQNCTKRILTRVINPEYKRLGDSYYTPDIILSTWYQSETGNIPVSGSGYGGPFSGAGFDSMWTDMSEIVRPTRDGIHGREYINTSVNIGRRVPHLAFEGNELAIRTPPIIQSPLPILFEKVPARWQRGQVASVVAKAALKIDLMPVVEADKLPDGISKNEERIVPLIRSVDEGDAFKAKMVLIQDEDAAQNLRVDLKARRDDRIVGIRLDASPDSADRLVRLVGEGAEVVCLAFDAHGLEKADRDKRHVRDVLRDVHSRLVQNGLRDQVTIVASGGIALPEHVAKAIICGADLVAVDLPLMIALECRLCGECERDGVCPVDLAGVDPGYAEQRIINLIGAWYHQLIEVLGAMGIREVRRLRGETGRAMFFEDLEEETFGRLFGRRIKREVEQDG